MADDKTAPKRLIVTADTLPKLPRHIKLRHDKGRGRWLILAPERVFEPDETAVEVLRLCNGEKTVAEIAAQLAAQYNAPIEVITEDVITMLQDVADRGVVTS